MLFNAVPSSAPKGVQPLPKLNRLRIALRKFWEISHTDPWPLLLHRGVAPDLNLARKELAFLDRLADRLDGIPAIGQMIRGLISIVR